MLLTSHQHFFFHWRNKERDILRGKWFYSLKYARFWITPPTWPRSIFCHIDWVLLCCVLGISMIPFFSRAHGCKLASLTLKKYTWFFAIYEIDSHTKKVTKVEFVWIVFSNTYMIFLTSSFLYRLKSTFTFQLVRFFLF